MLLCWSFRPSFLGPLNVLALIHVHSLRWKQGPRQVTGLIINFFSFFLVMLTSSAELSHCEQRAQSLFTNQLSSAPGLRESFLCAWSVTPMLGGWGGKCPLTLLSFSNFHPPVSITPSFICISSNCNVACGCYGSWPGGGCVVIPGNVIFILSHKSARQEPTQPPTWKESAADAHTLLQLATLGWTEVMALIIHIETDSSAASSYIPLTLVFDFVKNLYTDSKLQIVWMLTAWIKILR